ncbi:MAG: T9SS type A sorting domain-containing protein [Bacteroidales bacterium]
MKKYLITSALSLFLALNSYSQWSSVLNLTSSNTKGVYIAIDQQENIYSVGNAFKNATEKDNYFLVKYTSDGDTLWTRTYNRSNENDQVAKVVVDKDNNVLITGTSYSLANEEDIVTLKYNPNGDLLKTNIFDGTNHKADKAVDIAADDDGNYYICGSSMLVAQTSFAMIKTNNNLEINWAKTFTAYYGANPKSMSFNQTNQKMAITGYLTDWENDYFIGTIVYDSSGTVIWDDFFQQVEGFNAVGFDVHLNDDETVYVCGYETNATSSKWEALLMKYNSSGDTIWTKKVSPGVSANSLFKSIITDNTGNIFVTGMKGDSVITAKYSSAGELVWLKEHAGKNSFSTEDTRKTIKIDQNGNILVAARSYVSAGGGAMVIKYAATGNHLWTKYYNGSVSEMDEPLTFDLDNNNNAYVIINSRNSNFYFDMATVQFTPNAIPTTAIDLQEENLISVYPNPSQGVFYINEETNNPINYKVFSSDGRLVYSDKTDQKRINLERLPNGIYFLEIKSRNLSKYSKLIIQK